MHVFVSLHVMQQVLDNCFGHLGQLVICVSFDAISAFCEQIILLSVQLAA